jgi:hypothetical protein
LFGGITIGITTIQLARRDLKVVINHVQIHLETKKGNTTVSIEVKYDTRLGLDFMLANKAIKGLFNDKMLKLNKNIEAIK